MVCIHAQSPTPEQVAGSTNAQNTLNTLTVTFRANLRLEPGSTVTIAGLVGSTTLDGGLSLSGADAGLFTGAVKTGTLVTLTVADGQVRRRYFIWKKN